MDPLLLPLTAIGREHRRLVGGKAAHLGELLRGGFAVPPGFAVTGAAYRAHLDRIGLGASLRGRSWMQLDAAALEAETATARAAIAAAALPAEVEDAVAAALGPLQPLDVAVRSSALDEDQAASSFAGQHDTLLELRSASEVLGALRACWASLWSARAVGYRLRHGLDPGGAEMACVVQRMVRAEHAGVAFTADPVTGERDRIVVNGIAGLGDALVSGRATAAQIVLRKADGLVLQGDAARLGIPTAELARAAREAERHFGGPQDIEWAAEAGRLWLLQARPITGLPPEPVALAEARRPVLYYPERVREMMPGALTPLTADFTLHAVFPAVQENLVRHGLLPPAVAEKASHANTVIDGRVYLDLSLLRAGLLPGLDELSLVDLLENGRRPPLRALRPSMLFTMGLGAPRALWRGLRMMRRLGALAAAVCAELDALLSPLERQDLRAWTEAEILGFLRLQHPPGFRERLVATPPANPLARMMGTPFYTALERLAVRWGGEPAGAAAVLVSGLEGLPEVECAVALWDLAEAARGVPAVKAALEGDAAGAVDALAPEPSAQAWLAALRAFLDRFGHRAIEEVELARPRWRDQPAYPLSVIASYLRLSPEASPREVERRRRKQREETEARIATRLSWWRRRVFAFVLSVARQSSAAGETTKFHIVRLLALARSAALEIGRRRVEQGRMHNADDVFYTRYAELEAGAGDLRALVATRRREHQRWQSQRPAPLIDAERRPIREGIAGAGSTTAPPVEGMLHGIGSSPGLVRGAVRVIRDPAGGFELLPGEVLVAPFTDPAWTPLFVTAAAVVVETGSVLSHASIVARELGLPSVVAVPDACSLLRDGQVVEVDGRHGHVRLV